MNIPKAIEILADYYEAEDLGASREHKAAIKLGIEALRAIQRHQRGGRVTQIYSLPGETKENS